MIMGEKLKQVPWVNLVWPTLIAVIFYAYTMNVRATIREELRGYLTVVDYEKDRAAHEKWSASELNRLDNERDTETKRLERIERKLDELLLRK
jgi:hypothetical protein